MEAFIPREDPLREISSVWIEVPRNSVSVCARTKRANVQLVQLSDVFQERLCVGSKLGVVPSRLRPQLEMVSILREYIKNNKECYDKSFQLRHQHIKPAYTKNQQGITYVAILYDIQYMYVYNPYSHQNGPPVLDHPNSHALIYARAP